MNNDTYDVIRKRVKKACEARGARLRSRQVEALIEVFAALADAEGGVPWAWRRDDGSDQDL